MQKALKITIDRWKIIYVAILFIMGMSAVKSDFTIIGIGNIVLLSVYVNVCFYKNSIVIPQIIVGLLLFQNFCIGMGAHIGGNNSDTLSLITQVPTIFIFVSIVTIYVRGGIKKKDILFLVYAVFLIAYSFVVQGAWSVKLIYLRNFTMFYLAFQIGQYYIDSSAKLHRFMVFFLRCALFAAFYGLLGVIIGKKFYLATGVLEVYTAKQYRGYVDGMPGNFRTLVGGIWVARLASLYYDPVNFSYFMGLAVVIGFTTKYRYWLIILLCELLTFGKGGILIAGISIGCVIVHSLLRKYPAKLVKNVILLCAMVGVIALVIVLQVFFRDSFGTYMHFYGAYTGFLAVLRNPLGHGLGSAGNIARAMLYDGVYEASETGLLNMAYQIGIAGLALFLILYYRCVRRIILSYKRTDNRMVLGFVYISFAVFASAMFQENTLTPQCIVPYMLFIGAIDSQFVSKKELK